MVKRVLFAPGSVALALEEGPDATNLASLGVEAFLAYFPQFCERYPDVVPHVPRFFALLDHAHCVGTRMHLDHTDRARIRTLDRYFDIPLTELITNDHILVGIERFMERSPDVVMPPIELGEGGCKFLIDQGCRIVARELLRQDSTNRAHQNAAGEIAAIMDDVALYRLSGWPVSMESLVWYGSPQVYRAHFGERLLPTHLLYVLENGSGWFVEEAWRYHTVMTFEIFQNRKVRFRPDHVPPMLAHVVDMTPAQALELASQWGSCLAAAYLCQLYGMTLQPHHMELLLRQPGIHVNSLTKHLSHQHNTSQWVALLVRHQWPLQEVKYALDAGWEWPSTAVLRQLLQSDALDHAVREFIEIQAQSEKNASSSTTTLEDA